MLVHIKDLVSDANKNGYAIGAFNAHNLETVLGIADAALKKNSPAIIQVSEGAIRYMGLKPVVHIVTTVAKNVAKYIPIALHLDHGKTFTSVIECISAGFTSVHIDASGFPLDENVKITQQVVAVGHSKGVWVQGEVGAIVGGHGNVSGRIDIPEADPKQVVDFAKKTKVDTIAAAIGTAHGAYENEKINFDLLKYIRAKAKIPFVLHGGSGVPDTEIKRAIKDGVSIINIGTDIKVAFSKTLIAKCRENPDETDPRNLLSPCIDAVSRVVAEKMDLFGSTDRVPFKPKK